MLCLILHNCNSSGCGVWLFLQFRKNLSGSVTYIYNLNTWYDNQQTCFLNLRSSVFVFLAMHECLHSVTQQWIATHSLKTADLENSLSHLTVPAVPVLSVWQVSAHTWDKNTRTFAESRGASGGREDPSMPFVKPYCRQQERNLTTRHSFFRNNIKRPPHPPGKTAHKYNK